MRSAGPADFSSVMVFARKPFSTRFWPADELFWSAPCTQWWFVTTRPLSETNEALQPPSETIDESGADSGSESFCGSIVTPIFLNVSRCCGSIICEGIHMPPGFAYDARNRSFSVGAFGSAAGGVCVAAVLTTGWAFPPPQAASRTNDETKKRFMVAAGSRGGGGRRSVRGTAAYL